MHVKKKYNPHFFFSNGGGGAPGARAPILNPPLTQQD